MAQYPEAFGISVTVDDVEQARQFYSVLYAHDHVTEGVFAGINYIGIMRDGETLVNVFQKGDNNPLDDIIPILKVDSVATYQETVTNLGGSVLIPTSTCPCTGSSFAVCLDASGNQFMVKEPRSA
jgi:predicted enzyme related to lactoylglutathione lyase